MYCYTSNDAAQKPSAKAVYCWLYPRLGGGKSKPQKQVPKAITVGYTPKVRGGGKSVAKAKAKAEIGILKSYICKSKSRKSLKSKAKALGIAGYCRVLPGIAGYCAAVLVALRSVRGRQTVQFCAVALFSISSPPPCCRANKAHCKALQAAR